MLELEDLGVFKNFSALLQLFSDYFPLLNTNICVDKNW